MLKYHARVASAVRTSSRHLFPCAHSAAHTPGSAQSTRTSDLSSSMATASAGGGAERPRRTSMDRASGRVRWVGFGEAMLRFAPLSTAAGAAKHGKGAPSARASYMRSVGGDELNVMVAGARLGWKTEWVSVLPSGPMGDSVRDCAVDAGVDVGHIVTDASDGAELGVFTVMPDEKRVHYQRRQSSFGRQAGPGGYPWGKILDTSSSRLWMHATGITPLLGAGSLANWQECLTVARSQGVFVILDLNHRPALGTLEELWGYVEPFLATTVHVFVLSLGQLLGVGRIMGLAEVAAAEAAEAAEADDAWVELLKAVHARIGGPAVAACFKTRDERGVQRRWSTIVDATGVHSTRAFPTYHKPKDECGGGSAWAAGVMDALADATFERSASGTLTVGGADLARVARRADLLAALCQESEGDHSVVREAALDGAEREFEGQIARIGASVGGALVPGALADDASTLSTAAPAAVGSGDAAAAAAAAAGAGAESELAPREQRTLEALGKSKVLAILRAKNFDVAVARGVELVELGCTALEVTVDSVGFEKLVSTLVERVGDRCVVGAGTVMTQSDIERASRAGCRFALSPVKPLGGFIASCHANGMVAVPAAYTPQEIYQCVMEGAKVIKLFPAQLWNPSTLKDLRAVGMFGDVKIMPSGGCNPTNAFDWIKHGAYGVGMGSKLVGADVRVPPENTEALAAAREAWETTGREAARKLFKAMAAME